MKTMQKTLAEIMRKKLMWGVVVMAFTQILGALPALDFMPPVYLKLASFALGVALTVAKGVEMYFQQTAELVTEEDGTTTQTHIDADITSKTISPAQPAEEKKTV